MADTTPDVPDSSAVEAAWLEVQRVALALVGGRSIGALLTAVDAFGSARCELVSRFVDAATSREWVPVSERPLPRDGGTYLVTCAAGYVTPHIRGVIHNNVGTPWDWDYGGAITGWMPLPAPMAASVPPEGDKID